MRNYRWGSVRSGSIIGVPSGWGLGKNRCNTTCCALHQRILPTKKAEGQALVCSWGFVNFALLDSLLKTPSRHYLYYRVLNPVLVWGPVYALMGSDRGCTKFGLSVRYQREASKGNLLCPWTKKTLDKAPLSFREKMLLKVALKAVKDFDIELLLRNGGLVWSRSAENRRDAEKSAGRRNRRVKTIRLHAIRHVQNTKWLQMTRQMRPTF